MISPGTLASAGTWSWLGYVTGILILASLIYNVVCLFSIGRVARGIRRRRQLERHPPSTP